MNTCCLLDILTQFKLEFATQLASPKSKENVDVRAVAFDVVVTM